MVGVPTEPLRVGLLGCGWFSRRAHLPALLRLERRRSLPLAGSHHGVRVVAVCCSSDASLDAAERQVGRSLRRYLEPQQLFSDAAVDVILVALPIQAAADVS